MKIEGIIKGIKYHLLLANDLPLVIFSDFDISRAPSSFLLQDNNHSLAISKWVSPKRTRSYPYERVYNTLASSKKITVIPIVKDEGKDGDRDYIQWDTVSLMSLLDVFVIFAYYVKAEKKGLKIIKQSFDNEYIISKIRDIETYHSSALHWNLKELTENLHNIIDKVITSYANIEMLTNIKLHDFSGLENFKEKIGSDVSSFMDFSRTKSLSAQEREFVTTQPKESLSTLSKSKITIKKYLGGLYQFVVDEVFVSKNSIQLIESKHSKKSILPSVSDIKDGLIKMVLFSNLEDVTVNGKKKNVQSVLRLTSQKINGAITSCSKKSEIEVFLMNNTFSKKNVVLLDILFKEANQNNFLVKLEYSL